MPDGFFSLITGPDQRFATAQLVLTLTDSRGVGQVVFDIAVPKPSGELAPAGHSGKSGRYDVLHDLAFDYAFLLTQWNIKE